MSVSERTRPTALAALTTWRARQWAVTAAAALGCVVLIGVPTDLIETPLFSRAVPPTWWSYPVLAVSALLAGLLVATYVNGPTGPGPRNDGRWGSFGGALTFFAVGCPVCSPPRRGPTGPTGRVSSPPASTLRGTPPSPPATPAACDPCPSTRDRHRCAPPPPPARSGHPTAPSSPADRYYTARTRRAFPYPYADRTARPPLTRATPPVISVDYARAASAVRQWRGAPRLARALIRIVNEFQPRSPRLLAHSLFCDLIVRGRRIRLIHIQWP